MVAVAERPPGERHRPRVSVESPSPRDLYPYLPSLPVPESALRVGMDRITNLSTRTQTNNNRDSGDYGSSRSQQSEPVTTHAGSPFHLCVTPHNWGVPVCSRKLLGTRMLSLRMRVSAPSSMACGGAESDAQGSLPALLRGIALLTDRERRTGLGGNGEEGSSVTKCLLANLQACGRSCSPSTRRGGTVCSTQSRNCWL